MDKMVIDCMLCGENSLQLDAGENSNGLQQCLSCGFSTNDDFFLKGLDKNKNSKYKALDEFMKKHSIVKNDYMWIPSVMQLPIGIYYPTENDKGGLIWSFAPLVEIGEDEMEQYPNPNGGHYKQRYDMDNQLNFEKFKQGIQEINTVMQMIEDDNKSKEKKVKIPKLKEVISDEETTIVSKTHQKDTK